MIDRTAEPKARRDVYFRQHGGWNDTPVYERSALPAGTKLSGPVIVEEPMATTLLHPGETLDVDRFGNLVLRTSNSE